MTSFSRSVSIYIFIFWALPTWCVEAWIEKFIKDSEKEKDHDECLHQEQLSAVFSSFLMLFFTLLQRLAIIASFASIVKLVNQHQHSTHFNEYLILFGLLGLGEKHF